MTDKPDVAAIDMIDHAADIYFGRKIARETGNLTLYCFGVWGLAAYLEEHLGWPEEQVDAFLNDLDRAHKAQEAHALQEARDMIRAHIQWDVERPPWRQRLKNLAKWAVALSLLVAAVAVTTLEVDFLHWAFDGEYVSQSHNDGIAAVGFCFLIINFLVATRLDTLFERWLRR